MSNFMYFVTQNSILQMQMQGGLRIKCRKWAILHISILLYRSRGICRKFAENEHFCALCCIELHFVIYRCRGIWEQNAENEQFMHFVLHKTPFCYTDAGGYENEMQKMCTCPHLSTCDRQKTESEMQWNWANVVKRRPKSAQNQRKTVGAQRKMGR